MVGLYRVVHHNIHMIQGMWRFLCVGLFILRGFLIQSFNIIAEIGSKTHRVKVSTADSPYVVEGKITLVAVVQKSWFLFWTELGTSQRIIEVNWWNWVESMFIFRASDGLV